MGSPACARGRDPLSLFGGGEGVVPCPGLERGVPPFRTATLKNHLTVRDSMRTTSPVHAVKGGWEPVLHKTGG